jgi:hypothetical protein
MNTRIKYLFSLIAIFILVALQAKAKEIDDKQYKFKITVPDHWKTNVGMDGTDKVYDFLSPDEFAMVQLRSFKAGAGLDLDVLVDVYEDNYLPKGSKRLELINKTSVNGIPGKNGTYMVSGDGAEIGISVFYVIQKGQGYTLTIIIPTEMMAQYQQEVSSITQSFVIPGFERKTQSAEQNQGIANITNSDIEPFRGVELKNVKMGSELLSDSEVLNSRTSFLPQTENIYIVFDWQGDGVSGREMKIAWYFDQNNYKIDETSYIFPEFETQGSNNSVLSMPYQGWPLGDYHVEFSISGQIVYAAKFNVTEEISDKQNGFGDEKVLFEGSQVTGEIKAKIDYDDKIDSDQKVDKKKSKSVNVEGRYNFEKRSDGKFMNVSNYYILLNSDGTYLEEYTPPNSGNFRGGEAGIWVREGDKILFLDPQNQRLRSTYLIDKNRITNERDGVTYIFIKH